MNIPRSIQRTAIIAVVLTGLAACSTYQLVEAEPQPIGSSYRVEPLNAWNAWRPRGQQANVEVWTVDGIALQQVRLYHGIEPGNTLRLRGSRGGSDEAPRYQAGMRANDVLRVFSGTLELEGTGGIEVESLQPARFGDWPGFRFALSFKNSDGLAYRGLGIGAVDDSDRLHLIVYLATREHYFEAHRQQVERLFASIETL